MGRLTIRYSTTDYRVDKAEVTGELAVTRWEPAALGQLI